MDISWVDFLSYATADIKLRACLLSILTRNRIGSRFSRVQFCPPANFLTEIVTGPSADHHEGIYIELIRTRHLLPHSANTERTSSRVAKNLDMGLSLVISFFMYFIEINLVAGLSSIIACLARLTSTKVCQVYISFF